MGIEEELAFKAFDRNGQPIEGPGIQVRLFDRIRRRYPCLAGPASPLADLFLVCGRIYIDVGEHPELATAEVCSGPHDVVRYALALERIIANEAVELEKDPDISEILISKCNVDYINHQTWGAHFSCSHKASPQLMARQMIPHLVSRVIFSSAGGFESRLPGLEFMLSPRVAHIETDVSRESTAARGIYHTKDESLALDGLHRMHEICGEALCSQTSAVLKAGSTALVAAMADEGIMLPEDVQPASPLSAMRTFATDPHCKARVPTVAGPMASAVQIQRHLLALVETNGRKLPRWAPDFCRSLWRPILDRLERNAPESVATTLDWAIRYALYRDYVRQNSIITWNDLPHWTYVHRHLSRALEGSECAKQSVSIECVLNRSTGPIRREARRMTDYMAAKGLTLDAATFRAFLRLRMSLFALDFRFGQIGRGIFSDLDSAGVLTHRVPGVDRIDDAVIHPPSEGRAKLRGEYIQRLAGNDGRYVCNWDSIVDRQENRILSLRDPFAANARWRRPKPRRPGEQSPDVIARAFSAFERLPGSGVRRVFNVGDRVIVARAPHRDMATYVGRTATVTSVDLDLLAYRLDLDDGRWRWRPWHLRPADQEQAPSPGRDSRDA